MNNNLLLESELITMYLPFLKIEKHRNLIYDWLSISLNIIIIQVS
jgi:hypothetical protein